ncbi:hypothetical protein [Methylobacterium crusticola]|uniref:hypothetical protein n=1 Tax=Methylobacterium crusticola TaxID=1697972 RepID=UPI000FFC8365|nr:hypothetical protein [Methylobacterium crusticola]
MRQLQRPAWVEFVEKLGMQPKWRSTPRAAKTCFPRTPARLDANPGLTHQRKINLPFVEALDEAEGILSEFFNGTGEKRISCGQLV